MNQALGQTGQPLDHEAFGRGRIWAFGDGAEKTVEVYPQLGVIRLSTADTDQTFYRMGLPVINHAEGSITFSRTTPKFNTHFMLNRDGETWSATLRNPKVTLPEEPGRLDAGHQGNRDVEVRDGGAPVNVPSTKLPSPGEPVRGPVSPEPPTGGLTPDPIPQGGKEKQPRVKLSGRIGRLDTRENQKGEPVLQLAVAEKLPDGKTRWHTVYTTGERAKRLLEKGIDKGDTIDLEGYAQQHVYTGKDKTTKTEVRIYAVHIHMK